MKYNKDMHIAQEQHDVRVVEQGYRDQGPDGKIWQNMTPDMPIIIILTIKISDYIL